jgi:hypothetical protein
MLYPFLFLFIFVVVLLYSGRVSAALISAVAAFLAMALVHRFHKCGCDSCGHTNDTQENNSDTQENNIDIKKETYMDEPMDEPLIGDDEISRRQHYSNKQARDSMIYRNRSQRNAVAEFVEDELNQEHTKQWWGNDDWLDEQM